MARIYTVKFDLLTIQAGAVDLFTIPGPSAGKLVKILRVELGCSDVTLATAQAFQLRARYLPATVTLGSGGTGATGSITPSKNDPGDAACSITTARYGDTIVGGGSVTSTSGTAVTLGAWGMHLFQGFDRRFDVPLANGTAFVFDCESTVSGTVHLSGVLTLSEEG